MERKIQGKGGVSRKPREHTCNASIKPTQHLKKASTTHKQCLKEETEKKAKEGADEVMETMTKARTEEEAEEKVCLKEIMRMKAVMVDNLQDLLKGQ